MSCPGMAFAMTRDLSEPVPIPRTAKDRVLEILDSGRLFRYGEFEGGDAETAHLERDFARYLGCRYAIAMNSVAVRCSSL